MSDSDFCRACDCPRRICGCDTKRDPHDVLADEDRLDPKELVQEWFENTTPPKQMAHEYLWSSAHNLAAALRDTLAEASALRSENERLDAGDERHWRAERIDLINDRNALGRELDQLRAKLERAEADRDYWKRLATQGASSMLGEPTPWTLDEIFGGTVTTDVQPISDEQLVQLDAYFAHGEPSSTYRTIWAEEWFGIRERLRQAAAALDERDEARAECERLRAERPVGESYLRHLQDRRDTLKAQLARATEVLRWYADLKQQVWGVDRPSHLGQRARRVLVEIGDGPVRLGAATDAPVPELETE